MNRLWVKILLGVSLILNVFVIGAVAGVLIIRQQALARASGDDPLMNAADALSSGQRDAYRTMIGPMLQSLRPQLRDARIARRDAMVRFQIQPFDRAAASADFALARADDAAARARLEEALLDFAAKLPSDQRAAFAKGLSRAAWARWIAAHPGRAPPGR